ncbi:MAG: tetratricopeptide repeat protein [Syntrophales bacterium]|jgi:hypothetical protein
MRIFYSVLVLPFFLIILSAPVIARAGGLEADQLFSFAGALFEEGDYYRAIGEFKRFRFLYLSDHRSEEALFKVAESYYKARRWLEGREAFTAFMTAYPVSKLATQALYLKGMCEKQAGLYEDALTTFIQIYKNPDGLLRDQAIYQSARIYMDQRQWIKAKNLLLAMTPDSSLASSARNYAEGLERVDRLPYKSPTLAGTLAAILPGAGHLYAERPRDALVSFLLNGAFIWAAVESFYQDQPVLGGILAFFEVGWYAGNIYSAVNSIYKYNQRMQEEYIRKLQSENAISLSYDPQKSYYCFIFNFHF